MELHELNHNDIRQALALAAAIPASRERPVRVRVHDVTYFVEFMPDGVAEIDFIVH